MIIKAKYHVFTSKHGFEAKITSRSIKHFFDFPRYCDFEFIWPPHDLADIYDT